MSTEKPLEDKDALIEKFKAFKAEYQKCIADRDIPQEKKPISPPKK